MQCVVLSDCVGIDILADSAACQVQSGSGVKGESMVIDRSVSCFQWTLWSPPRLAGSWVFVFIGLVLSRPSKRATAIAFILSGPKVARYGSQFGESLTPTFI